MNVLTKDHLDRFLRKQWKRLGVNAPDSGRMGLSIDEIAKELANRNATDEDPYIEIWIAIFDEYLSWLISLVTITDWTRRKQPYDATEYEMSTVLLLMRIVSDSLAIRHLVLHGFDAAAMTVLRATAEHIEVLVAIITAPELAESFAKTLDSQIKCNTSVDIGRPRLE